MSVNTNKGKSEITAVMTGIGGCLPAHAVKNEEIAERIGETTDWITERTGIEQRFVLSPESATSDLAVEAGRRALESCGNPDVEFLILATCTPDHLFPSTAPAVAARLGFPGIAAFDLNAACSGFIYSLSVAEGLLATGRYATGLVIGSEAISTIINPDDKITAPLFGDGAGAVVMRAGVPGELGSLAAQTLGSDGSLLDIMKTPGGGSRQRAAGVGPDVASGYFGMAGRAVYKHAVSKMTAAAHRVLDEQGWSTGDVDWLVAHQANRRILTATAASIGIPAERAVINVDQVANTSAASIPLALLDAAAEAKFTAGDKLLLVAFGGGVTWAAAAMTWPGLTAAGPAYLR